MASPEERLTAIEGDLGVLRNEVAAMRTELEQKEVTFLDNVNLAFTQQKLGMTELIEGARSEFAFVKQAIQELHGKTEAAVVNLELRTKKVE